MLPQSSRYKSEQTLLPETVTLLIFNKSARLKRMFTLRKKNADRSALL